MKVSRVYKGLNTTGIADTGVSSISIKMDLYSFCRSNLSREVVLLGRISLLLGFGVVLGCQSSDPGAHAVARAASAVAEASDTVGPRVGQSTDQTTPLSGDGAEAPQSQAGTGNSAPHNQAAGERSGPPCPEKSCSSGQVCLTKVRGSRLVSRSCVPNPCGAQPVTCSCAASLCGSGEMCTTSGQRITCGTRCAAANSPIATPFGERPISTLQVGELVYSRHRGQLVAVPIIQKIRVPVTGYQLLQLEVDSGRVLQMSAGHPAPDGRLLHDMKPGEPLGSVRVKKIRTVDYPNLHTYDILPDSDSGTYLAAGALVGSTLFSVSSIAGDLIQVGEANGTWQVPQGAD